MAPVPADGAKPTFTEKPVIRQSDDGTKIIFECRLIADPKPSIEWYLKGSRVKESSRHKFRLDQDKHTYLAALEISNVSAADSGEYKLVAKNSHGDGSATIGLNFDHGKPKVPDGKAPRFPRKPVIRQEGPDLILECLLESKPLPEITWYHGSVRITDSRRTAHRKELSSDTFMVWLNIKDPTDSDGGMYRCHAVNDLGESNANIALNFLGGEDQEQSSRSSSVKGNPFSLSRFFSLFPASFFFSFQFLLSFSLFSFLFLSLFPIFLSSSPFFSSVFSLYFS